MTRVVFKRIRAQRAQPFVLDQRLLGKKLAD